MPCLYLILILGGVFGTLTWALYRLSQAAFGVDTPPMLIDTGQGPLPEPDQPRLVLPIATRQAEPLRKDPSIVRDRAWIVREWTGGVVDDTSPGTNEAHWIRDGYRFRCFEKRRDLQPWTLVMAVAALRFAHGFQVRPIGAAPPFPAPLRPCSQPLGVPELDEPGGLRSRRFAAFLAADAPDLLPLTRATWECLAEVVSLAPEPVVLDVQPARTWVTFPGTLFESADARAMLETICRVLDAVLREGGARPVTTPITLLQSGASEQAATCPVCAEAVGEGLVKCARCGAPHHAECWDYVGACSVYACRSTVRAEGQTGV